MVESTQTISALKDAYVEYTDKYFLRSKEILRHENINPIVRYQIFARENIDKLKGVDEAVEFIRNVAGKKVIIHSLKDGQKYRANLIKATD